MWGCQKVVSFTKTPQVDKLTVQKPPKTAQTASIIHTSGVQGGLDDFGGLYAGFQGSAARLRFRHLAPHWVLA